jgi:thiosulfate reductase cytochrome b subunit
MTWLLFACLLGCGGIIVSQGRQVRELQGMLTAEADNARFWKARYHSVWKSAPLRDDHTGRFVTRGVK